VTRRDETTRAAASVSRAQRSLRTPLARSGTCVSAADGSGRVSVQMDDGSSTPIYAQCLGERPAVGQRVTVEFWPPNGAFVTGVYGGTVRLLGKATQTQEQDFTTEESFYDLRLTVTILSPGREVEVWTKVYCEASAQDIGAQVRVYEVDPSTNDISDPIGGEAGRTSQAYVPVAAGNFMLTGWVSEVPDIGERTYQATLTRVGGAGTITALCENTSAELVVRDVGPAVED
jgi:hypothetical protein